METAYLLVRRFGLYQASRLFLPETIGRTRLSKIFRMRIGTYTQEVRTRDSAILLIRPFSMDLEIFHEIWDYERYTPSRVREVASGGVVVDIGAHIGLFSVFASRALNPKRIICVEPNPQNFELLRKNLSNNRVEGVRTFEIAIAGQSGERRISIDPFNSGGHSLTDRGGHWQQINVITLQDLFDWAKISDCALLKMDCEGAEMEILDKASDELLARMSAICFEYH